jgi:hypothetical protein
MAQAKTWVAFDVHISGVVAAVLNRGSGELWVRRLPAGSEAVAAFGAGLAAPVRATYEAGPTGFVLARRLDVEPRQVVQLVEASHGRAVAEGAVGSSVIVGPEPAVEGGGAFAA